MHTLFRCLGHLFAYQGVLLLLLLLLRLSYISVKELGKEDLGWEGLHWGVSEFVHVTASERWQRSLFVGIPQEILGLGCSCFSRVH